MTSSATNTIRTPRLPVMIPIRFRTRFPMIAAGMGLMWPASPPATTPLKRFRASPRMRGSAHTESLDARALRIQTSCFRRWSRPPKTAWTSSIFPSGLLLCRGRIIRRPWGPITWPIRASSSPLQRATRAQTAFFRREHLPWATK